MIQRHTTTLDSALAALMRTLGRLMRRVVAPVATTGRPVGGPVVFRHYL